MKAAKNPLVLPRRMVWLTGTVHRRAKVEAARRSTTIAKLVEEALARLLTRDGGR
jgi:predicted HicB family RNase H-like nuclease